MCREGWRIPPGGVEGLVTTNPPDGHISDPESEGLSQIAADMFDEFDEVRVLLVNARSLNAVVRQGQLEAHSVKNKPSLILVTESWLDDASQAAPHISAYRVIARRDRHQFLDSLCGSSRGGIIAYARIEGPTITEAGKSDPDERIWLHVHTQLGVVLECLWYRPPDQPVAGILRFQEELVQ